MKETSLLFNGKSCSWATNDTRFLSKQNHRQPAFHSKARNAQLTKEWPALKYTILLFFVTQIKSIPQFIHCILMKRSTFIRKTNCLLYCLNR